MRRVFRPSGAGFNTNTNPGCARGYVLAPLRGGALNNAADKLPKDLLQRAANVLKVDAARLQIRDGVISSTEDPKKRTTFADLVKADKDPLSKSAGAFSASYITFDRLP